MVILNIIRLSCNIDTNEIPNVYGMFKLEKSNYYYIGWLKMTMFSFLPKVIKVRILSTARTYLIKLQSRRLIRHHHMMECDECDELHYVLNWSSKFV